MAEVQISRDDIDGLAHALDELNLPAGQRALLSAIVAVAANAIGDQEEKLLVVDLDPVPSFHDQFATAFTPDQASAAGAEAAGAVRMDVSRAVRMIKIGR
jgi:hypothetical protein